MSILSKRSKVVIATVKALTTYLSNIEDKEILKHFSSVLPTILRILVNAVKEDENAATSILQSFGELIETHSNFIKSSLEDIFIIFAEILVTKELQNGNITKQSINQYLRFKKPDDHMHTDNRKFL